MDNELLINREYFRQAVLNQFILSVQATDYLVYITDDYYKDIDNIDEISKFFPVHHIDLEDQRIVTTTRTRTGIQANYFLAHLKGIDSLNYFKLLFGDKYNQIIQVKDIKI